MKGSIEPKEKDLIDYMQEIGNNLLDYCMRHGITKSASITVMPPDYINVGTCDRYENGGCADCEDCNTCHFYRPHWKYQFCVYAECPYEPGKLTALRRGTAK